jgi:hypothetical protein
LVHENLGINLCPACPSFLSRLNDIGVTIIPEAVKKKDTHSKGDADRKYQVR